MDEEGRNEDLTEDNVRLDPWTLTSGAAIAECRLTVYGISCKAQLGNIEMSD